MTARQRRLLILLIAGLAVPRPALPCSSFAFPNKGLFVFGTNYDNRFAPGQIFINKRGVRKAGWETGTTGQAARWFSRYGSVTIACAGYQLAWGGMNEAGLVFSTMALSETRVPPPDERPHLAGAFWWQYMLDTCATIEEVKAAAVGVRISDTVDHYLVCDRTGDCAVVECLDGRLTIRSGKDLPVRALANDPYQECLDHWTRKAPGPDDPYYSVNRFSRLADGLTKFEGGSAAASVEYAFGLLAGVAASNTRWSFVCDTGDRVFYLKSYKNPKVRFVDLKKIDFDCNRPTAMLDAHADLKGDITAAFHDYSHDEVFAHMVNALAYFRPDLPAEMVRQALILFESFACVKPPSPAETRTGLLAEWEDLRFGMFIHYGMSTFTGQEFGETPAEPAVYAPTSLDVDQWIRVARDAGMKYAVLTAKHCYGHALWDSKFSDYDVAAGSDKTDVLKAFVEACRKYDVRPGFYYLLGWDKHNQVDRTPEEYEKFCVGQIEEILSGYGQIAELWLDIPWDMGPDTDKVLARIYAKVKSLQPRCLVLLNQSFVDGSEVRSMPPAYMHKEFGRPPILLWPKDLINGEVVPPPEAGHNPLIPVRGRTYYLPMETCDTLAHHWFWMPGDALKSVRTLVRKYQATVPKGANLLLDLAPDKTGRIPEATAARLMEMKAALADPSLIRPSLTFGAKASASNVYKNDPQYAAALALDGDSGTRWATDEGTGECRLEVDLGAERAFDGAFLSEGWDRVREYALEVKDPDGTWKAFHRGTTIGVAGARPAFPRTTGRFVRLHVLKAEGAPTFWDFELYEAAPAK